MFSSYERDGLFDFGGGEGIEGVRRWGGARDVLGDLLEAVENHCDGSESAVQSIDGQRDCILKQQEVIND